MPWFVLYTKSRNEKVVAEKLRTIGVEVYCPLIKTKRKWSDRSKIVEEPLFRSYCFVRLEEKERSVVFSVPGVVRYLFWLKKPAIVQDSEIDTIKFMLNEFDHELIHIHSFEIGDRLKIQSGLFTDFSGTVIQTDGKRVAIYIDSLQMALSIDTARSIVSK